MATSSIGYYERVVKFMGGRKETEDFFRLFLIPGVHHGGLGPGFTEFDSFTALENWVERGIAPDKLIASRTSNGAIERSRPGFVPLKQKLSLLDNRRDLYFLPHTLFL